jgi:hypothetical protein
MAEEDAKSNKEEKKDEEEKPERLSEKYDSRSPV